MNQEFQAFHTDDIYSPETILSSFPNIWKGQKLFYSMHTGGRISELLN